ELRVGFGVEWDRLRQEMPKLVGDGPEVFGPSNTGDVCLKVELAAGTAQAHSANTDGHHELALDVIDDFLPGDDAPGSSLGRRRPFVSYRLGRSWFGGGGFCGGRR